MKDFFLKNILFIAIGAIVLFGIFKKKLQPEVSVKQAAMVQNVKKEISNIEKEADVRTTTTPVQSTPLPTPIVSNNTKQKALLDDPLCLNGKRNFTILPSIYLSEFYEVRKSWIAIPQSYASCFTTNKDSAFYFFEFNPGHQLPFEPLVRMSGRIVEVQNYPSYSDLKKENPAIGYNTPNQAVRKNGALKKSIYDFIEDQFNQKLNEPWAKITISAYAPEVKPSHWPKSPTIHPLAQLITLKQLNEILKSRSNVAVIDVRNKKDRKSFTLPIQSLVLKNRLQGFGDHIIGNLSKMSGTKIKNNKKALLKPIYVLVGTDNYDYSAYNAANMLSMRGAEHIYILEDGASAFGGPSHPPPPIVGQGLDPDQLKGYIGSERSKLAIIDTRNASAANAKIPGAKLVPRLPKAGDDSNPEDQFNFAQIQNDLKNRRAQYVVLYGSSRIDENPSKVYKGIQSNNYRFYQLEDGFKAWSFFAKYKWSVENALVITPKQEKRNSPAPERHRVNTRVKSGLTAARNTGATPKRVKTQKVSESDLKKIINSNQKSSTTKKQNKSKNKGRTN